MQILQIDNTSEDIKGTSETIARVLQPYNIRVAHKPITTLRQLLTNIKDKDEPSDRQGAVKKIKCCDYQATYITYISETSLPRSRTTALKTTAWEAIVRPAGI